MPSHHTSHVRMLALVLVLGLLAAACGSGEETATTSEPDVEVTTEAEPSETETEEIEAKEPPVLTLEPSAPEPTETETAAPSAAPVERPAPSGDLVDLPTVSQAAIAAIGRSDVTVALTELGPFPADVPFPDDAVLAQVRLSETDIRLQILDPEVQRPISNEVSGTAVTRLKNDEAQAFYLEALPPLGFELSSSGFSTTTQGDGTEVRGGLFTRGGFEPGTPERETISLTLVARADTDFVEAEVAYSIDAVGDTITSPISQWSNGFPAPEGYQLYTSRMSTFYFGRPSLSFSASYGGPAGEIDGAIDSIRAALPAGGFELSSRDEVRGDPDLRSFDIVFPDVGEGDVAVSSRDQTDVRPSITVDFPVPASLEPFLLG
ncbi:hypothetical protein BH23ACT9_BH23ACT9_15020 [soil metagenome]